MMLPGGIKYITRNCIDIRKWDRCIEEASNGLIYAHAFYLDNIAVHWDALVLNDYEAVMPLTWNRKYGFYYLYQPPFTATLGVFVKNGAIASVPEFLQAIPRRFRLWDFDMNESNHVAPDHPVSCMKSRIRINYFLPLTGLYQDIYAGYKRLARRMIRKAADHSVTLVKNCTPAEVIGFYRREYRDKHKDVPGSAFHKLLVTTTAAFEKGYAHTYTAKLPDGDTVAAYLVLADTKFVYSVIGGSSLKGKDIGAFYFLTNAAIKDHAGTNRIFRFEGSDITGIAFFDEQFGPSAVSYQHVYRNNLPFPLKWLK